MSQKLRWPLRILAGIVVLLVILVLVLGLLPVAPDVPPHPAASHIGAPDTAPTTPPVEGAPQTITVKSGEKIQDAVDRAKPGDTVAVMPGTYHEAVTVSIPNITLTGVPDPNGEWPILDGQGTFGTGVMATASFFTIEKLDIRNYNDNGVKTINGYGTVFRDLRISNTGEYGIYPVKSTHVLVERVAASKASDTALYIGQSRDIIVQNNEAFNSVSGIEIENSIDALVQDNYVHDNTAGILVFVLPHLDAKEGHNARIIHNRVENNSAPNFATHGIVEDVPSGIGILVMIADDTEVAGNTIKGNRSGGVGIVSAPIFFDKPGDLDIPLVPERTWLHDNTYDHNGYQPDDFLVKAGLPGVDVLWDAGSWDTRVDDAGVKTFPPLLPSSAWPDLLKRAFWRVLGWVK